MTFDREIRKQDLIINKYQLFLILIMSYRFPFTEPNFNLENMKVLKNLLEAGREKYNNNLPAKEKEILPEKYYLSLKAMLFAIKPSNLMRHFENISYFKFIHEMAKRLLTANREEVLYCRENSDSKVEFGGPIPVTKDGLFSEEGKNRVKHAANLICKRLKTSNPPYWAISKDFSFEVQVERRILPKTETDSEEKTEGDIIPEKENDSKIKSISEKKNSKKKAVPEEKKSEPEEWEKVDFSTTATKDYEFQYKIFTSQGDNFIFKDVRSVLLAIMLPMRVPGQDLTLVEYIISSPNSAEMMNELYTIFKAALFDIGHLLESEVADYQLLRDKENNSIKHRIGSTIRLVFEALSAWQKVYNNDSEKQESGEDELELLGKKWMKFKEEFSKISDGNKNFVSNIQFLGPQSLEQQSWENSQLEFFRKNKHSWVKTVDFAFVKDPEKIQILKGKACIYSLNFFRKTKDYDYWVNMLNVVKVFLKGVETKDKYVDFEIRDEKTASYIYWVFMYKINLVEKKLNFFKEYNITKCSQEIEIIISLLEERKKKESNKKKRKKKKSNAKKGKEKENNTTPNDSLVSPNQSNETENQSQTASNGNKHQARCTLENESETFKKIKTEID